MMRKKGILAPWLAFLFALILGLFWYNEGIYKLPTPVPKGYRPVAIGTKIDLTLPIANNIKPTFIHFFNPDCPCSKFNIKHVKALIANYRSDADFIVVLVTAKDYEAQEIKERYLLDVPVIKDEGLAKRCGVYSTPQAVILDGARKLYYRGNYNRNRYCTDKKTNYAEQALMQLINNSPQIKFNQFALRAYGCQLPGCKKD